MTVTGGNHSDTGGEIVEFIAVDVGHNDAAPALCYQRVGARVGRRNILLVPGEHALGIRAWQSGLDFWSGSHGHGFRGHGILRESSLVGRRWSLAKPAEKSCEKIASELIGLEDLKLVATEEAGTKAGRQIRAIAPRTHNAVQPPLR